MKKNLEMALEITGKVHEVLETQKGEGKNGPWQKGAFVLETGDQFPKNVHCIAWGDMINQVEALHKGDEVKASIDIQSREYNGRWYTDVKVWRLEKLTTEPVTPPKEKNGGSSSKEDVPPAPKPPQENTSSNSNTQGGNDEDDLPF